jgi:1-deoxy-D-xylulose-5-phosphate reductoisomerase
LATLEFIAPRDIDFPALRLAREAGLAGGTLPAVFNAANEIAVDAFIAGKITFPGIWYCVESTMQAHQTMSASELEPLLEADRWARSFANQQCKSHL